ncbi:MAG: hypothetical protein QW328_05065 [Nitrososphaerota archaeon]
MQVKLFKSCFTVRLYQKSAAFYWSLCPAVKGGNLDLKAKIPSRELLSLARELGCEVVGSRIIAQDIDPYNRLIIYAAVRPTVTSPAKAFELMWFVRGLTNWDAHYWASRFRELWWEYRCYRGLLRVVKAFKLFFGLD